MRPLARLITRRPWLVLLVWGLALLLSLPLALSVPRRLTANPGSVPGSESGRVTELLRQDFGERGGNAVLLVVQGQQAVGSPAFERAYGAFMERLRATPGVLSVARYDAQRLYRTVSEDGHRSLSVAQIALDDSAALARIRALAAAQPEGLRVGVTGAQAIADDFTALVETDTKRSELVALPLTALVLFLVFGALVAMGLPLVTGMLSIGVAMAALYGLTTLTEVSTFAQSVITMLGLGAGIDYALLMVNRFREELAQGHASAQAAERTMLTAGRSVLFSGITVAVAMAAMIVPPITFVRSMGIGGVLAVLLTVAASVTALPALLTLLGERVNSPRRLHLGWGQNPRPSPLWSALARRVIGRPWLAVTLGTLVLLALAWPAGGMRLGYAGAWGLAQGVPSRDALKAVDGLGAGGLLSAFEVVLDLGHRYTPADRERFRALVERLSQVEGVKVVISPFVSAAALGPGGSLDQLAALAQRSISADRSKLRLTVLPERALRADKIDPFAARLRDALSQSGFHFLLGGAPIGEREFSRAITGALPGAVALVFAATFLLLALAFRSLVIPLKSLVMNSLTVGAAYGVVTLVVQDGLFASALGVPQDTGVLDSILPLILFAVLFGLSMDYEIFLLSRVQEEHLRGASLDQAIVRAVGRTGRIITSAAAIMFIVFAAFIFGRVVVNKSIGLGLAVAVLLDATLVRLVLVPGVLKLAGRWNWWLPAPLERALPRVRVEH